MRKGSAFSEGSNDDADEGEEEIPANDLERDLI